MKQKEMTPEAPTEKVLTDQDIILSIRKKLLLATEQGDKDLEAKYADELAEARADAVRKKEIEDNRAELENRDLQRKRAEKISAKCVAQRKAIDALLEARDSLLPELRESISKAKLLPGLQQEAMAQFFNAEQLGGPAQRRLPQGYLPSRLKASTLVVKGGMRDSVNVTTEALFYLRSAYSLLNSLERLDSPIPQREPTLFETTEEEIK